MNEHCVHLCGDRTLERISTIRRLVDAEAQGFESEVSSDILSGLDLRLVEMRVEQQRNPVNVRQYLPDDLDPFPGDFRSIEEDSGHISAGPVQALSDTTGDRVGFE